MIPIYEAGEADGLLYIAMRYVEGTDLKRLLAEEGRLEPARAVGTARPGGRGARRRARARPRAPRRQARQRADRDAAGREHVYLADFGLSRQVAAAGSARAQPLRRARPTTSPPSRSHGEPLDGRADVYALGCVLYECLAGQPPFQRSR